MDYLVTILVLLAFLQTRIMDLRRAVYCLSAQSAIIALSCIAIGLGTGNIEHGLIPAVLTILVKVIFIPGAVLKIIGELKNEREVVSDINTNSSTVAAALFLVLGYAIVGRVMPDAGAKDVISASILMIMTGLSLMVLRKRAVMQIVGLITLENGIYLLGLLLTRGLPLVVELGVFLDVLIAVVVLVILTGRMRLSFMTTDTSIMKKLKG